jgi:hypothetical protein
VFLSSAKKLFHALQNVNNERIRLISTFEEFGDTPIQITEDIWADLLPELLKVDIIVLDVNVNAAAPAPAQVPNAPREGPMPRECSTRIETDVTHGLHTQISTNMTD